MEPLAYRVWVCGRKPIFQGVRPNWPDGLRPRTPRECPQSHESQKELGASEHMCPQRPASGGVVSQLQAPAASAHLRGGMETVST